MRRPPEPRAELGLAGSYHSPQVEVEVRLNTNESPIAPPAGWYEAIADAVSRTAFHRYPDREARALREALAGHHGVAAESVWCANGSNEVIEQLCLAYAGAGRAVALFEPTYQLHAHIARLTGAGVIAGVRDEDFGLLRTEVERVLTESVPAVTFLCSPNNPTGRAESPSDIAWVLERSPGLLVVDEAYVQFAPSSVLDMVAGSDRLVVVRTFSKTWAMAGMRLGYCVAPPAVVDMLQAVSLPYHLDALSQVAGCLALRFEDEMRARVALLTEERGRVQAALGGMGLRYWPSDANFVLFRSGERGAHSLWEALVEASVLVRDCSTWPGLEGCLRVTIGTAAENDRFLEALGRALG